MSENPLNLSKDCLRGAAAIAKFRGESVNRTRYLIRKKIIPTYREGGIICASKKALIEHHMKAAALTRDASEAA